ncbi:hypothetical protein ZHAS_00010629 [Anopheles sinensis]|uniref:Uncharacterized protein n=1 Tax=Anopheles sinensis TaxID=74873 RepID=A0A084VY31_ANOSI|nr:hypothetical protein ZHAS_00010629 [Anopheles sinensis]
MRHGGTVDIRRLGHRRVWYLFPSRQALIEADGRRICVNRRTVMTADTKLERRIYGRYIFFPACLHWTWVVNVTQCESETHQRNGWKTGQD